MNKTNLQRFAELFKDEDNIQNLILDNFSNQDDDKYTLNGIDYYIFTKSEVQDLLDEDFENEVEELSDFLGYGKGSEFSQFKDIVRSAISIDYNDKSVPNDFDNLKDYEFESMDDSIFVYTRKY
jgi:hypothetical protein